MRKQTLTIISVMVIATTLFVGCSQKSADVNEATSAVQTAQTTVAENVSETNSTSAESTTKADESTTQATTEKKETTSTTAKATTKANTTAKQTTKATTQTTQKVTQTTTKQTTKATTAKPTTKATTKATTTVKNVSASDVQAQVNSYIRSKGITVDTSLRPNNSGWSCQLGGDQRFLNDGTTLRNCKEQVDYELADLGTNVSLYCYYEGDTFYILYM